MLVEQADGTLFLAGYAGGVYAGNTGVQQVVPRLWRSMDHGSTWSAVGVGTEADGAIGNSDVDLAVAPDGTLYFATMGFDRKSNEGTHIAVGVGENSGQAWHWTTLSKKRFDDRPWIAVTPDGAAHVVWNDGAGVYYSVSKDHGATWSAPHTLEHGGGSSHFTAGPNGELAVRITPISASGNRFSEETDLVAVSTDGGVTWRARRVPGQRNWVPVEGATPRWVEPLAWDARGSLFLLWTEASGVWVAQSVDRGESWRSWRITETAGDDLAYFPYLVARGQGELAATWFSGAGASLRWRACSILISGPDPQPRVACSSPLTADSWAPGPFPAAADQVRSPAGEYLPVVILRSGDLAVASPIQNAQQNRYGFAFWRFKGPAFSGR